MSKIRDLPESTSLTQDDLLYAVEESAGPNGGRKVKVSTIKTAVALSDAEIKTKYENNPDTNAFTDAEKTKLAGIEAGATADQIAIEVPYSNISSGLSATEVQSAIDEVNIKAQADFRPSIVSGRILHYTGGTARFDGVFYSILGGDILLNPNITNGEVYVDLDGLVKQTSSGISAPPYTVVFAKFSTDLNNIISLTDERVKNAQNIIRGTVADVRDVRAGASASEGNSGRVSDAMHKHNILTGPVSTQTPDQSNAEGTSINLSRADHIHNIPTDVPVNISTANSQGTANTFSKSDHVHAHGAQTDATLHAVATQSLAGFMSAVDKFELDNLIQISDVSKEPTGFSNRTDSQFSFDNGTRTFTISPVSSSYTYWIKGVKYTKTGPSQVTIVNSTGVHFIYFNGSSLVSDLAPADVALYEDVAYVSAIYWDATNSVAIYLGEERHGISMHGATHSYLHDVMGTQFISGFALDNFIVDGDGSLDSHAKFSVENGSIADEDIRLTIAHGLPQTLQPSASIPIYFRIGTGSAWQRKSAGTFPFINAGTASYTATNGLPAYNLLTGSTWSLQEVTNNYYFCVHYFATNDVNYPIIGILGQDQFAVKEDAIAAAPTEIAVTGLPFAEFTAIGAVLFKASTSYVNTPKTIVVSTNSGNYIDFRAVDILRPGAGIVHGSLAGLADDDHQQYLNRSGVRAMEGDLNMGTFNITSVGTINSISIQTHGSRHAPAGADPVPTAIVTDITTIQPDDAAAAGTANNFARGDHKHAIVAAAAVGLDTTSTNTEGNATSFARSNHTHNISSGAPSTQLPDQSNSAGTSANFAKADHIHNIPAATPSSITTSSSNTKGTAQSFALSDHLHNVSVTNDTASATADDTTTSVTDVLMVGMTLTPAAGTYLVLWSGSIVNSANGAERTWISYYVGGSQVTATERSIGTAGGAYSASSVQAAVTVNGSQAIELRWRVAGGTSTVRSRRLTILKIG